MTDYTELKHAASEAKNWGGEVGEGRWYTAECFKRPYFSIPDAEFIAACEPGAVLALINDIATLKAGGQLLVQDRNDALAERAQLKAENETLRKDAERLQSATDFVQKLCDSAGNQPSVATGYLYDILAAMGKGGQS